MQRYYLIALHFVELSGEILLSVSTKSRTGSIGPPENSETISSDFASKNIRVRNAFGRTLLTSSRVTEWL